MKKVAAGKEKAFRGVSVSSLKTKEEIAMSLNLLIPNVVKTCDVVFLCIGTDRSTGDSLGPHVGMYLEGLGYTNVYGTINNPVHAMNLADVVNNIPKNKIVIAIDACLGKKSSVETVSVIKGSIKPGTAVGKTHLPEVGDYSIYGIVNLSGFMEYLVLQNTELKKVIKIAKDITSAIVNRFPVEELHNESRTKKFVSRAKNEILVNKLKKIGLNAKLVK